MKLLSPKTAMLASAGVIDLASAENWTSGDGISSPTYGSMEKHDQAGVARSRTCQARSRRRDRPI